MHKIKVLHVIRTFNLGGAETNLRNMLLAADTTKVEPHVAYSFGGPFESEFRKLGMPVFRYAMKAEKVASAATPGIIFRLANYIRKNRIQIVHTHNFNAHVWGSAAAKLAGAKVVEHVHDFRYEPADYLLANGIARPEQFKQAGFFAKLSDRIVVLTRNNEKFITGRGLAPQEKVRLIPNAIPLNGQPVVNREQFLTNLGLPLDRKIIFWAVRLSPEKNPAFVLDIAEGLRDREDVLFVVAGDGPLRQTLDSAVVRRQLSKNVRYIGFCPEPLKLLTLCDVAIQPTFLELHSIMMMEAMSVKKPVLVSKNVGCNNDFISHGANGYLLDPRNAKEWSAAIRGLLEKPEEAGLIGREGRKLLEEKCTMERLNHDFEALYAELVT